MGLGQKMDGRNRTSAAKQRRRFRRHLCPKTLSCFHDRHKPRPSIPKLVQLPRESLTRWQCTQCIWKEGRGKLHWCTGILRITMPRRLRPAVLYWLRGSCDLWYARHLLHGLNVGLQDILQDLGLTTDNITSLRIQTSVTDFEMLSNHLVRSSVSSQLGHQTFVLRFVHRTLLSKRSLITRWNCSATMWGSVRPFLWLGSLCCGACELPTASSHFGSTGVLWVLIGTHPCGPPPRQDDGGYQSASSCCGLWSVLFVACGERVGNCDDMVRTTTPLDGEWAASANHRIRSS